MKLTCEYSRFTYSAYLVAAVLLVVCSILIAKGEDVLWINHNHTPFLDRFMVFVTQLGAGFLFLPLLIVLLFVRFRYAVLTALVWIGHGVACAILKRVVFGPVKRPAALLDNSLLYFVPDVDVHSFFSFPSGHTATMFCFAFLLSLLIKKRWATVGFLLIALAVGYSRIYLLQHFLVDVAWGAMIGVLFTYFVWRYFETAKLPTWMDRFIKINRDLSLRVTI
jgi:membrane-associated phospholipid phosphatase